MRRYNMVSWILLILTVITFALAAPVLVQDKRQAWVDVVHVPEVVTILGKRIMDKDLDVVWHRAPCACAPREYIGRTSGGTATECARGACATAEPSRFR